QAFGDGGGTLLPRARWGGLRLGRRDMEDPLPKRDLTPLDNVSDVTCAGLTDPLPNATIATRNAWVPSPESHTSRELRRTDLWTECPATRHRRAPHPAPRATAPSGRDRAHRRLCATGGCLRWDGAVIASPDRVPSPWTPVGSAWAPVPGAPGELHG